MKNQKIFNVVALHVLIKKKKGQTVLISLANDSSILS